MRKAERASGRKVYASHEWTKNRSKTKSKTVSLVWSASAVTPTCLVRSVPTPSRHTQEAWLPRWRAVSLFPSLFLSLWLAITLPTSNRLPRTRKDPVAGAPLSCKRPVDFLISWTYRLAPRCHDFATTRLASRSPADPLSPSPPAPPPGSSFPLLAQMPPTMRQQVGHQAQ